ncbi:MAG TPA: ACT domain-containing protein [Rectinemataceae bacterium]|nr:ACT domain-containing protein [Rectinemataceae bacterium]
MQLTRVPGEYSICRLDADAESPPWANRGFVSITRTEDELSIVCLSSLLPSDGSVPGLAREDGWGMIKVLGPLDFGLTGVISSIAAPLADHRVSIFSISTYDTDYFLVKQEKMDLALGLLRSYGFELL